MAPDARFSDLNRVQFERAVAQWRRRAESLKAEPSTSSDLNAELIAAIETLNIADEQMRQQNDALLEAREAIDAERDRYQSLFELAPDAYIVTNVNGVILDANTAATHLLGTTARYLLDKPLTAFVDEAGRRTFRKQLDLLCGTGLTGPWLCDLCTRGGAVVSVEMTVASVRDRHAGTTELRWIIRDVTKRKRAEEHIRRLNATLEERVTERTRQLEERTSELRAVNQLQEEMLQTIGLEVRTSLHSLLGHTTALSLKLPDGVPPLLCDYLEQVEAMTAHIIGILNGLVERAAEAGSRQLPSS